MNQKELKPKTPSAPVKNFNIDLLIGMSDGLVVPFSLAAGLYAAGQPNKMILLAGLASIAAGSLTMGLSGYFSGRSEQDEHHHHNNSHDAQPEAMKKFFANLGLSETLQEQAAGEILKDKDKWTAIKMQYDQQKALDKKTAARSGWMIGFGYVAGGLLTLSPYFITETPGGAFRFSILITLVLLFITGWFKGLLQGNSGWWSALRLLLTGMAAAAAAYGVAKIFLQGP